MTDNERTKGWYIEGYRPGMSLYRNVQTEDGHSVTILIDGEGVLKDRNSNMEIRFILMDDTSGSCVPEVTPRRIFIETRAVPEELYYSNTIKKFICEAIKKADADHTASVRAFYEGCTYWGD